MSLRADGLDVYYGEYQVLHDVSLEVGQGELVALFGPNGHGKSTLLKTLAGLVRSAAGSIEFESEDITRKSVKAIVESGLLYVPEERHLFLDMTVRDNLRLGAYVKRARVKEQENYELVFQLFPRLEERQKQLAGTLSGGEAQMLAMGRGLMGDASFMLIDEPSLGLAPQLVDQIFASIKEINSRGIGILLVEQNVLQTCDLAERVYMVEEGRVVMCVAACDALSDERIKTTLLGS
jgi:branched-chain amino acid transport system ATP-binding protein